MKRGPESPTITLTWHASKDELHRVCARPSVENEDDHLRSCITRRLRYVGSAVADETTPIPEVSGSVRTGQQSL